MVGRSLAVALAVRLCGPLAHPVLLTVPPFLRFRRAGKSVRALCAVLLRTESQTRILGNGFAFFGKLVE